MLCNACGKNAISTGHNTIYRFVPKSEQERALFCKICAARVHAFVNKMIETGGQVNE